MYSNHAIIDPYLTIPGRQPRNQNHASNGEVLPALNTCLCGVKGSYYLKKITKLLQFASTAHHASFPFYP